jgi:hypothetical protein
MSDGLAALATRAGFQTRQLFTNDQVHTIEITRPFMLNGIGDFIHRPDLLDRAIPLRFEAMPLNARRTEEQIRHDFEEVLPELLHDLYMAVAHAIREIGQTPSPTSIRMADAAHWVVAAEEGAGLSKGTILAALEDAQASMQADLATQDTLFLALERVLLNRVTLKGGQRNFCGKFLIMPRLGTIVIFPRIQRSYRRSFRECGRRSLELASSSNSPNAPAKGVTSVRG